MKRKILLPVSFIFILIIGLCFTSCDSTVNNEYGFLGFDKMGRQIFIQTLNEYFQGNIKVESEFYDYNFLQRFFKEPTRTTLRFNYIFPEDKDIEMKQQYKEYVISEAKKTLGEPIENILTFFDENYKIFLTEDKQITVEELQHRVKETECFTVRDFYKGLGFKKYQVQINGKEYFSTEL